MKHKRAGRCPGGRLRDVRSLTTDELLGEIRELVDFVAREWEADKATKTMYARSAFVARCRPLLDELDDRWNPNVVRTA
ncbi:MAG: hypothetical protein HQ559_05710 [Lentisphaerae bacterium]|nr:hypothetical protein [Lentisphaerota bacterium]